MILALISFIAGMLTILAPCVLPLLPVIIGGSVAAGGRARPYLITLSLAVSIIGFTLLLKVSTVLAGLPPSFLTDFSGGLLIALGLVSLLPTLWENLMARVRLSSSADRFLDSSGRSKNRIAGPLLTGLALGPVFTSCSPLYAFILATVLPHSLASGLIYLVTYTLGLSLTLLAIALAGRRLTARLGWLTNTHGWFRRIFGLVFILVGLAVITGLEVPAEVWVGNHLPFDEAKIEQVLLNTQTPKSSFTLNTSQDGALNVAATPAPQFVGLANWINSPPLKLSQLKGHVVLVDFWTYSCINCIRTLPYVEKWYSAYHNQGLDIIGISTPEFAFEHVPANVAKAVKKDGILYPVALDNNYDTWDAFHNTSWPADYLIDKNGDVRYVSIGEGDYSTTERAIQQLLGVNEPLVTPTGSVPIGPDQTPETYFGTNRASGYAGSPNLTDGTTSYLPATVATDQWTLSGSWTVAGQSITSNSNTSKLTFAVDARDVYTVAGNSGTPQVVTVSLPHANAGQYGSDAPGGQATITGSRLYHIVSLPSAQTTTVTLTVPKGVSLYTFTFGS